MKKKKADEKNKSVSYPGDGERHVEVLPPLQPEAPGPGAGQRHGVGAHCSRRLKDPPKVENFYLKKTLLKVMGWMSGTE